MTITVATLRSRVETDLDDTVLQGVIDAALQEIETHAGPPDSEIEVKLSRGASWLILDRAVDSLNTVQERRRSSSAGVGLAADDYRLVGTNRILRLTDGTNPAPCWGDEVEITFAPLVLDSLRDQVQTNLCLLDLEFGAYDEQESGDWSGDQKDFVARRKSVLARLKESRAPFV